MTDRPAPDRLEEETAVAAIRAGDQAAFSALAERHRRALRVHCYRMVGSFDDAEDLVQETLLRAWRGREGFEGRSLFRTWLYRIATNACLTALEGAPARAMPQDVAAPVTGATPRSEARPSPPRAPEITWLQPYPDEPLAPDAGGAAQPDELVEAGQTIELAFIAALQHLPPRQRAILILADVVGWSAKEIAELLELSVASVTSALQRAHAATRARLPAGRGGWAPNAPLDSEQRSVLQRFMRAWEAGDVGALTELLREDARWAMPPAPLWFDGRAAIESMLRLYPPTWQGRQFRMFATAANGQPAAAAYLRQPGETVFRLSALLVLRVEGREIAEITTFGAELCAGLGLAATA